MAGTAPVGRLRRIAAGRGGAEDGAWFAEVMERYGDPFATLSLDEAAGLVPMPGAEHWRTVARRALRDEAIRALAGYFPGLLRTRCAAEIATMLGRYAASRWRVDRARPTMPEGYRGTPRAHLWAALVAGGGRVPGARWIREILALSTPLLSAGEIGDNPPHGTSTTRRDDKRCQAARGQRDC